MERRLAAACLGAPYRRFVAVDGTALPASRSISAGALGCWHSHAGALQAAPRDGRFVHILEDDVMLSRHIADALKTAIRSEAIEAYDIVFTDTYLQDNVNFLRFLKGSFDKFLADGRLQFIDLKGIPLGGTTSYLVNPKSLGRIASLLAGEVARGPTVPIDIYLREQVSRGALKAGCLFPFVTCPVADEASTISAQSATDSVMLMLRRAFFIDAEFKAAARTARNWLGGQLPADDQLDFIADLLKFCISSRFRPR